MSCDELLIDCSNIIHDTGVKPEDFAIKLREQIFERTQCCASVGIGKISGYNIYIYTHTHTYIYIYVGRPDDRGLMSVFFISR